MSQVTHMDKSRHTYGWVMSHTWMSHVMHEWVMPHIWMRDFTHMNEYTLMIEWVTSHVWMSHVRRMNESWHVHEWVTPTHITETTLCLFKVTRYPDDNHRVNKTIPMNSQLSLSFEQRAEIFEYLPVFFFVRSRGIQMTNNESVRRFRWIPIVHQICRPFEKENHLAQCQVYRV